MPAGKRTAKQQERAALKASKEITLTIRCTEETMQRLAALLLFAEAPAEVRYVELGPLPYETADAPAPVLQVDYAVVRRDIVQTMDALLKAGCTKDDILPVIRRHGAETLARVPEVNLLPLWDDLNRMKEERE